WIFARKASHFALTVFAACMCAQPNNFAQPTARKGSEAPESIKNERIGESDSGGSLLQCNQKSPSNGRETSRTRKIFARSVLLQPEFQKTLRPRPTGCTLTVRVCVSIRR